jgi:sugar/nucleoside kinase (ribokinase family)
MRDKSASGGPILCLGEAIVDLICEEELDSPAQARSFRAHFGGALANVAVAAAREGAAAALAGGVGDDDWGQWLRARLLTEGVDLRWFSLVPGLRTPLAFATFDRSREPRFAIYGDGIEAGLHSVRDSLEEAIGAADALVFGSNTLAGEPERALTFEARRLATAQDLPVLFDPNIRPNRWRDLAPGLELCREVCDGAFVVRANLGEAREIAGLGAGARAEDAAEALVALGARTAVVTLGPEGALARGEEEGEAAAPRVDVVSPLGAGDSFLGALAAGAARRRWTAGGVVDSLEAACAAGARACASWGALA